MSISEKQRKIMAFPFTKYSALICDGAIRSGKTMFMIISFVDDAMRRYNNCRFGICGKTVDSTIKNIITPYLGVKWVRDKYQFTWKKSEKIVIVRKGNRENIFEIFGGRDESSFMLIQGRTLAGCLFDEVALMPRSFVEQACARCSVDGSRLWFNCNPGSPQHWFYQEWIKDCKEKNALHLHFLLDDNPSLSEEIKSRYKTNYKGVFYERYVLGEWVLAEGLVYDFGEENITDEVPENGEYFVSCDYGTLNPFSAGLWCVLGSKAFRIKEIYYDGRKKGIQKTDEDYCKDIAKLVEGYNVKRIVVDPSAASFIAALVRKGYSVQKADNDVLNGIHRVSTALQSGNLKIHRSCENSIAEFGLYRWNEKSAEDAVVKENDHAMDDIRYFVNSILRYRMAKEERQLLRER